LGIYPRLKWLFADTPKGAKANAVLYTLVETAKVNKLDADEFEELIIQISQKKGKRIELPFLQDIDQAFINYFVIFFICCNASS
jgi:hypothetical protein